MRVWTIAFAAALAQAHDIPNDVAIQAFLKPEARELHLLLRVPMKAMRDVQFPERANGSMDIGKSRPELEYGAKVWIADSIAIYEGEVKLPAPHLRAARVSLESDKSFATYEQALANVNGP